MCEHWNVVALIKDGVRRCPVCKKKLKYFECYGFSAKEKNKYMLGRDIDRKLTQSELRKIIRRVASEYDLADAYVIDTLHGHLLLFPYDFVGLKKYIAFMENIPEGDAAQIRVVKKTKNFMYRLGGKWLSEKIRLRKFKGHRIPSPVERIICEEGFRLMLTISQYVKKIQKEKHRHAKSVSL